MECMKKVRNVFEISDVFSLQPEWEAEQSYNTAQDWSTIHRGICSGG